MKKLLLILSLGSALLFGCASSPVIIDGGYSLLSSGQRDYCARTAAERRELFADATFRSKKMGRPAASSIFGDRKTYWPGVVRIEWAAKEGVEYLLVVKDEQKNEVVFSESIVGGIAEVDNLEIAASYTWRAEGANEVFTGKFKTADEPPRFLRFPGVPNVRDLGGRIGYKGYRIRQGLVFRSAGLNENASGEGDNRKAGASRVEGKNGEYIRKRFKIKTDIDLRSDEEVYGMTGSPLGPTVTWRHVSSSAYGGMQSRWGREQFTKVFNLFLDRTNYPIDFHCIAGQDRTGAVAFILGALLGLDEDTLALEWEVTGFWNRDRSFCHEKRFDHLVNGFKKRYAAPTIRESVEKYVRSLGFKDADIETFRSIMLDGYAPADALRVAIYVGIGAHGYGPYRHVQIGAFAKGVETVLVDDRMIREGVLKSVRVLVMPGGSSPAIVKALGESGVQAIRDFVAAGGGYIGTCAGAIVGSTSVPGYREGMANLAPYKTGSGIARPMADIYIRFTPAAEKLLGCSLPPRQRVSYSWGPIFSPAEAIDGAPFETLATYDGEYLDKDRPPMNGKIAIVAGTYQKGRVFLSAVHPEVDIDDYNLLCAALKYVSGLDTTLDLPFRSKRGQLSVGVGCDKSLGVESMSTLLELMHEKSFDMAPVGKTMLAAGEYDWFDVLLIPDAINEDNTPSVALDDNTEFTKAFLARGGRIVVWGRASADYAALGEGVTVVSNGTEAIAALRKIDEATRMIEVAYYGEKEGSCAEIAGLLARTPGFRVKIVTGKDIVNGALKKADLLVMSGGSSASEYASLGEEGAREIVRFVRDGGAYYGICAGAFLASRTTNKNLPRLDLVPWQDPSTIFPGFGTVDLKLTEEGKRILGGADTRSVIYWGGPVFEAAMPVEDADIKVLATYNWHIVSTSTPNALRPMDGRAALLAGRVGKGKVYLQGPQLEMRADSMDLVKSALMFLTGREITGDLPAYRRGQIVLGCEAPNDAEFMKFYLKLIGYHNVFYRNIRYGYPANNMQRLDALLIANPTKKVFEREAIRSFITSGRFIIVVAATEEERAACKGIPGLIVVRSYDQVLSHFER